MGSPGYLSIFEPKGLNVSSWHQIFPKMKENVYKNTVSTPSTGRKVNIEVEDRSLSYEFCREWHISCLFYELNLFSVQSMKRQKPLNRFSDNLKGHNLLLLGEDEEITGVRVR